MSLVNRFSILLSLFYLYGFSIKATTNTFEMKRMIDEVRASFMHYYAPLEWKSSHFNWEPKYELRSLKNSINDSTTLHDFQHSLKMFFDNSRDYHTGIRFTNNGKSTLPLSIKYIDGEFYVSYIDKALPGTFPLKPGDRVTHFNERPVKEVAHELMGNLKNPSLTDWSLAARALTHRAGARLDPLGFGPLIIKATREEEEITAQLVWDYSENTILQAPASENNAAANIIKLDKDVPLEIKDLLNSFTNYMSKRSLKVQGLDLFEHTQEKYLGDPQAIGKKNSFIPKLSSSIVWKASKDFPFDAYIYLNDDKQLIGFIRIARYVPIGAYSLNTYARKFGQVMKKMEDITDYLVIDQLNNPGGSVFYLYALASMLTTKPIPTPRHRFSIDSLDAQSAQNFLNQFDKVEELLKKLSNGLGTIHGYPLDIQFFYHLKSYFQFILKQWNKGNMLTDPYYLYGVDYIQPHPKYQYTKNILLLTNELDFSGGDFFPAILQDANRATIMGSNTAGAGGYIVSSTIRNRLGVMRFSYTGSIAYRQNGEPLENLGVTPDITYQISKEDLKTGFTPLKNAINLAVEEDLNDSFLFY